MPIITITSDWNRNDYYLPSLKGRLFSLYTACAEQNSQKKPEYFNVVDISSTIKPFDIFGACFILKNSFYHYPDGTIHIIAVESESQAGDEEVRSDGQEGKASNGGMVVAKACGHYFIGPDDGRFGLLFDGLEGVEAYRLSGVESMVENNTFMALGLFEYGVKVVMEGRIGELEPVVPKGAVVERAAVSKDMIVGRVIYVDSYGNAITNISKENFFKVVTAAMVAGKKSITYTIYVQGPYLKFGNICERYSDVDEGEEIALFNSLELLEFAINKGNFAAMEGTDTTSEVVIKFKFE